MHWSPHYCGCRQIEDIASCDLGFRRGNPFRCAFSTIWRWNNVSGRKQRSRNLECLILECVKKNTCQVVSQKPGETHEKTREPRQDEGAYLRIQAHVLAV